MDGYNGVASHLLALKYRKWGGWAGQYLKILNPNGSLMQPNILFEVDKWYKFTITGKPLKSDGSIMWSDWKNPNQVAAKCRHEYFVEGPGLGGVSN